MAAPGQRRYICMLCTHIYDEAEGDPDSGLAPGTLWEDIPETWKCPQCGASKRWFENEEMFQQMTPRDENAPTDNPPPPIPPSEGEERT
jgi:rubredoxin